MPWLVWLSWLENSPIDRRVVGSIPCQGWVSGVVPGPGVCERQLTEVSLSRWCFSSSLSPSLPLFLKSIGMSLGEDKKNV